MKRVIKASSASRVLRQMQDTECMFITAYRSEYSRKENTKRNKRLASDLRGLNLGFVHVKGAYIENYGTDNEVPSEEDTFFVVNTYMDKDDFVDAAITLCGKYDQEAVMVTYPSEDGNVQAKYLDGNGNVEATFNNVNFKDGEQYFTQVFNKQFVFSSDTIRCNLTRNNPCNIMSKTCRHLQYTNFDWDAN